MKRFLRLVLVLFLLLVVAVAGYFIFVNYLTDEEVREVYSFVPEDFVYVIESDRPVRDWEEFSGSEVWQFLKTNEYFGELSTSADMLDSLLATNELLVRFIKLGDLLISTHLTAPDDYAFVVLVDMRGLSKLQQLGLALEGIFKSFDYEVSRDDYFGNTLWRLRDPATGEVLSLTALDNVLVASYDEALLKKAVNQSEAPPVTENPFFDDARQRVANDGSYALFFNFGVLEPYLRVFSDEIPAYFQGIGDILAFSAFDFEADDASLHFDGFTRSYDSVPSFLNVFKEVDRGRVLAPAVLPPTTAFTTSVGFDDFSEFYSQLEGFYQQLDPQAYEDVQKNRQRFERLLKIDLERDVFSWMTEEIAIATVRIDSVNDRYAYYGMLHFDDYELAKAGMDRIAEQVRKRSPARFREVDHRGVPIRYLELKGFFRIFLRSLFDKIEQPHYTFAGDYVVFSNDVEALTYLVDGVLEDRVLAAQPGFQRFERAFESRSHVFSYFNTHDFYPLLRQNLEAEYRRTLERDKAYLLAFPHLGFQLYPDDNLFRTVLHASFDAPREAVITKN